MRKKAKIPHFNATVNNSIRKENNQPQIAIDGNTLRHSFEDTPVDALHSITAWNSSLGLVVAQMKSIVKKNENESVLKMLDMLNIKGAHITVDALNTQKRLPQKSAEVAPVGFHDLYLPFYRSYWMWKA